MTPQTSSRSPPRAGYDFVAVREGHYRLTCLAGGLRFEVDHLRRDRHELLGELSVFCDLAGTRTVDGVLSWGTFNVSSVPARGTRARDLAEKAMAPEIDFAYLLEVLCQNILRHQREGQPAVALRDVPRPSTTDAVLMIDEFPILRRHPVILFGDGGTGKSTIALYFAGQLERRGVKTLYLDWELEQEDQRVTLEKLFPGEMPDVKYRRCEQPLAVEIYGIERQVLECGVDIVICDSIMPAADGPAETAEAAQHYFRALRQLRVGSLSLAHVSRAENADKRPFGSAFWHNLARATWYAERAETPVANEISVGLYNRKNNVGRPGLAVGLDLRFEEDRISVIRTNVADNEKLAVKLSLSQRMRHALKHGPKTVATLADELGGDVETLHRYVRRYPSVFTRVSTYRDGVERIALAERRSA
jgi:hypothetical protein